MTDKLFIFAKKSPYTKSLLGEIQADFNQSFVIDGTKDTTKVVVMSFTENQELEPNTICYHENTETWWIIAHDKVEKYLNEEGNLYVHELSLEGAIELLNARDLINCGFNQNRYDVKGFINRLFSLSNFEYNLNIPNSNKDSIDLDKKVDYVKTYENYTLLSALRDFLDGYNCSAKLNFDLNAGGTAIENAILRIVSKTGGKNAVQNSNYFNDVKEIQTINKNSFGTIVVSNAENVISSIEKRYPLVGGAKLSGSKFVITPNDALLRLPSKVFKVNSIQVMFRNHVTISISNIGVGTFFWYNGGDITSIEKGIDEIITWLDGIASGTPSYQDMIDFFKSEINKDLDNIIEGLRQIATMTIYSGNDVDPTYNNGEGKIIKGENVPYLAELTYNNKPLPLTVTTRGDKDNLPDTRSGIAYEKGSNIISGFEFIAHGGIDTYMNTDYRQSSFRWTATYQEQGSIDRVLAIEITIGLDNSNQFDLKHMGFSVNYIPMADLKIKIDNQSDKNDIQLYNQNGKLTDSRALSKLLNSYSKEISSDTITKYKTCYAIDDIKPVGTRFLIDNEIYVVNNLSIDFTQNENGYLCECEYTMSKQFAVKSIMVNPNTNIRDYGIPQNFNVERKQLYRDYFEFSYAVQSGADNDPWISSYEEIFNFGNYPKKILDYVSVIECEYAEEIGGNADDDIPASNKWYYQLDTTKYELDKMLYVVLNFNDNNIIGYSSQNVYSGFDIKRVFTNWFDSVNTPISYVDDKGELVGIKLRYLDAQQITAICEEYKEENSSVSGYDANKFLYNMSCFIPKDIYDKADPIAKLEIDETTYNKDALEVPVFEYCCQIGDSTDVLIGDNILTQDDEDYIYLYNWRIEQPYTATTENAEVLHEPTLHNGVWTVSNSVLGQLVGTQLRLNLYATTTIDSSTWEITNAGVSTPTADKDVVIFRYKIKKSTNELVASEPFMILRNIPATAITGYMGSVYIILQKNQYRLK